MYDAQRRRVVAIIDAVYDWDGSHWIQGPPVADPRILPAVSFDAQANRYLLFGGYKTGGFASDTWELIQGTWTQRTAAPSPGPRMSVMTWDRARKVSVLFGGQKAVSPQQAWGDTWTWDGTGWSQEVVALAPAARLHHSMTYDSDRQLVLLFGGVSYELQSILVDLWAWDGTTWTQELPARTPPAQFVGEGTAWEIVYDGARHEVVAFGLAPGPTGWTAQTWVYGT